MTDRAKSKSGPHEVALSLADGPFVIQQEQDGTLRRIGLGELDLDAIGYIFVGVDWGSPEGTKD